MSGFPLHAIVVLIFIFDSSSPIASSLCYKLFIKSAIATVLVTISSTSGVSSIFLVS